MSERRQGPDANDAEPRNRQRGPESTQGFSTNPTGPPPLVDCLYGLSSDLPACNCGHCHHEECQ
jgi:hypothetical protein